MLRKESNKLGPLDLSALSVLGFYQVNKIWTCLFYLKEESLLFFKNLLIFALFLYGEFKMKLYTFRQLILTGVYMNANLIGHPNSLLDFQDIPYHVAERWRQCTESEEPRVIFIILSRWRHRLIHSISLRRSMMGSDIFDEFFQSCLVVFSRISHRGRFHKAHLRRRSGR